MAPKMTKLLRNDFSYHPIRESDLHSVLRWRNSSQVRYNMFENELIAPADHLRWFRGLGEDRKCWVVEYREKPVGVFYVYLKDREKDIWIWGCYLGDPGKIRYLGTMMGLIAMECFFEQLGIGTVIGEMIAQNSRSRQFNLNIGFDILYDFVYENSKGEKFDAVFLQQNRAEWQRKKQDMFSNYFLIPDASP